MGIWYYFYGFKEGWVFLGCCASFSSTLGLFRVVGGTFGCNSGQGLEREKEKVNRSSVSENESERGRGR